MKTVSAQVDFEAIVTNSVDTITVLRKDGSVLYMSPSVYTQLGYSPDELVSTNIFAIVHPLDVGRIMKILTDGIAHEGKTYTFDVRCRHKNAGWKTLECSAQFLPNAAFHGILVHSRDITVRKMQEKIITESMDRLRKLSRAVDQSSDSIVITDKQGTIEYVNPAFVKVTGYTSSEAIGKNPRILQSGKTARTVYEDMWKTLLSGKTWHGELLNKKKDGSLYWESATFSPVFDDQGSVTHFLAIKKEITREKEIADKLSATERQFQQVIETITNGITIHDQAGKIIAANPAALEILGLSLDQILGKKMFDPAWSVIHEDGSPFDSSSFPVTITVTTGIPQKNIVMGVRKPDGMMSWILTSTVILGLDETTHLPKGVITSFTDITAMRNAAEVLHQKTTDLERMNKLMVGRELKMVELKNELKALRGGA